MSEPGTVVTGSVKLKKKAVKKAAKTIKADAGNAGIPARIRAKATKPDADVQELKAEKPKKVAKKSVKKDMVVVPAELSPAFKALADPKLPELQHENRARLLMQSPTRLYFYWSVRQDPYQLLKQTFGGDTGSYTLVVTLKNLRRDTEEIHPATREGNWWFDVEPDGRYQAEIGFYAPNRPYFRIVYSNAVETPRRSPSPHRASEAQWSVSANKFAEVLDVAGFSQDAFDIALAGDDHAAAEGATHSAFSRFIGSNGFSLDSISAEDIRYAMIGLASGVTIEDLQSRVTPALFAILQANTEKLTAGSALAALGEHFDIDEAEFTEEQMGAAVYGASLVNFPRTLKTRRVESSYAPVSSHSLR